LDINGTDANVQNVGSFAMNNMIGTVANVLVVVHKATMIGMVANVQNAVKPTRIIFGRQKSILIVMWVKEIVLHWEGYMYVEVARKVGKYVKYVVKYESEHY
jgi:hypothetical protein